MSAQGSWSRLDEEYYTLQKYEQPSENGLTAAMEDYLEMICRLAEETGFARVHELAEHLHVRDSSASKMAGKLAGRGLLRFERYGLLVPTEEGWQTGRYLLWRHETLLRFFQALGGGEDQLARVEPVEHFLDRQTVENLQKLTEKMENLP